MHACLCARVASAAPHARCPPCSSTNENKIVSAIESLDGTFDQIFITTGALVVNAAEPEKTIRQFTSNSAIDQFVTNAVGPTLILKHIKRLINILNDD